MKKLFIRLNILVLCAFSASQAFAQADSDTEDLKVIELELEKSKPKTQEAVSAPDAMSADTDPKNWDYTTLGKLAPFSEISVIQKRFMPKTNRVQFNGAITTITNDPFFNTTGFAGRIGYFFSEAWGLEGNYYALSTEDRQTTKELKTIQGVQTQNLVYPKSFLGLDLVYVPIYGKISLLNKSIIPFDLYFAAGFGSTQTQAGESAGTLHLATGQIFSITKAVGFRWDFSWNVFSAKGIDSTSSTFNNLFLSAGLSFFYPEAKYR